MRLTKKKNIHKYIPGRGEAIRGACRRRIGRAPDTEAGTSRVKQGHDEDTRRSEQQ